MRSLLRIKFPPYILERYAVNALHNHVVTPISRCRGIHTGDRYVGMFADILDGVSLGSCARIANFNKASKREPFDTTIVAAKPRLFVASS